MQNDKKAIVWSIPNCPGCAQVKQLLTEYKYEIEERVIHGGVYTPQNLQAILPNAKTVPQVFINGNYIGDTAAVRTYLNDNA